MKCYTCGLYPSLFVGNVGQFKNGVLELDDPSLIRTLEQTDSFRNGIIREYAPPPDQVKPLPTRSDVIKMTKVQLENFANEYGLEVEGHTRNNLVTAVLDFVTEAAALDEAGSAGFDDQPQEEEDPEEG